MTVSFRPANEADIPAMMKIRNAVKENALVSTVIDHQDYVDAMTRDGRAWVAEDEGRIIGFVNPRLVQADIWALFVDEAAERRGAGHGLMDLAEAWLFERGVARVRLVTAPETKAERLYRRRGWADVGRSPHGEIEFELTRQSFEARRAQ
jgi:GNAT superfamily N-acetyltransferase